MENLGGKKGQGKITGSLKPWGAIAGTCTARKRAMFSKKNMGPQRGRSSYHELNQKRRRETGSSKRA